MKRRFDFPEFSIINADVKVKISLKRFEKQFQDAQFYLDSAVMTSMVPFMPMRDGNFINITKLQSEAIAGSGKVIAGAPPTGRFLYEGLVMVDPVTGSPWARKGAKKVVTDRPLQFDISRNPKATDHWFDAAKQQDGKEWIKEVKKIAGGKK